MKLFRTYRRDLNRDVHEWIFLKLALSFCSCYPYMDKQRLTEMLKVNLRVLWHTCSFIIAEMLIVSLAFFPFKIFLLFYLESDLSSLLLCSWNRSVIVPATKVSFVMRLETASLNRNNEIKWKRNSLTVNCGVLTNFNGHLMKLDSQEIPPGIPAVQVP